MTATSATMSEAHTERDDGGSGGALTERRSGADDTTSEDGSAPDSSSEVTEGEVSASRNDKGKGKAVEVAGDDDEQDDDDDGEEDEEDEDEDEDDDDEDEDDEDDDDEDEEPRLKYARLTTNLGSLYRNGDATSAFLVAGDKMVGAPIHGGGSFRGKRTDCTDKTTDRRNAQWQYCKYSSYLT